MTHHPHYKICSRHFLLLRLCTFDWFHLQSPIKIYYKDPFFVHVALVDPCTKHKGITNLDMLSFSRFSRHSATIIWFYMFVFLKRMMTIVAMIPGLRALCVAWGATACIFCASASCAVFCLPVCQDSLKRHSIAAFSNHPEMQHKAAQRSLISIFQPWWTLPDEGPFDHLTYLTSALSFNTFYYLQPWWNLSGPPIWIF